jgi:hypothetical protein
MRPASVAGGGAMHRALATRAIAVATVVVLATGLTSCLEVLPTRLVVETDTLVVYKGRGEPIPYLAFGRRGGAVLAEPKVTLSSDTAAYVVGEWLKCHRAGASDVTIEVRGLRARLHAVCRDVVAIHGSSWTNLELGGPGHEVRFIARLADGSAIPLPESRLSIRDTTVAVLRDGRVVPRSVGHTALHVNAGIHGMMRIDVVQRLAADTLELRPGEYRQWPLVAGRYDIAVRDLSRAPRSFAELEMIGEGTRCVPARRDADLIHCLVSDTGVLVVQNRLAAGAPRAPRTLVSIVRTQ